MVWRVEQGNSRSRLVYGYRIPLEEGDPSQWMMKVGIFEIISEHEWRVDEADREWALIFSLENSQGISLRVPKRMRNWAP